MCPHRRAVEALVVVAGAVAAGTAVVAEVDMGGLAGTVVAAGVGMALVDDIAVVGADTAFVDTVVGAEVAGTADIVVVVVGKWVPFVVEAGKIVEGVVVEVAKVHHRFVVEKGLVVAVHTSWVDASPLESQAVH